MEAGGTEGRGGGRVQVGEKRGRQAGLCLAQGTAAWDVGVCSAEAQWGCGAVIPTLRGRVGGRWGATRQEWGSGEGVEACCLATEEEDLEK